MVVIFNYLKICAINRLTAQDKYSVNYQQYKLFKFNYNSFIFKFSTFSKHANNKLHCYI